MLDLSSDDTDIIPVTSALSNIIRKKIGHDLEKMIILREVLESIEISESLTEGKHDNIYISNIVDSDAIDALNGALNIGDTIFSINKESFIGISYERAKQKIKKLLNNKEKVFVISFFPADKKKHMSQKDSGSSSPNANKLILSSFPENQNQINDDKVLEIVNNQEDGSSFYIDLTNQSIPEKKKKFEMSTSKENISSATMLSKMIAVDQLESALIKIGFFLTDHQAEKVRENLRPNGNGEVKYEDFIKGITDMLLKFDSKDDPFAKVPSLNKEKKDREESTTSNQVMFFLNKIDKLTKERDAARKREQYLKNALMERDRFCLSLKEKLKASYQTIEKLEEELSILLTDQEKSSALSDNYRQPEDVVLYNLHQSETQNRAYEVCINKLMKFVEKAQNTIKFHLKKCSIKSRGRQLFSLATSAGEVMDTVKSILVEEPLPYGWEKVFSSDNNTYFYINHSTQQTSWIHPITGVMKVKSGRVTKI